MLDTWEMWQQQTCERKHSKSKRPLGVCGLGFCLVGDSPIWDLPSGELTPELQLLPTSLLTRPPAQTANGKAWQYKCVKMCSRACFSFIKNQIRWKEQKKKIAWKLRVLAGPPKDQDSIPAPTWQPAHSCLWLLFQGIWCPKTSVQARHQCT